jgi:hypothetical protein
MNAFINSYCSLVEAKRLKSDVAVFVEPKIDSGYPDIVIVYYNDNYMMHWTQERNRLSDDDLKILALVFKASKCTVDEIATTFGFSHQRALKSIELLADCGILQQQGKRWKTTNKSSFFGIKRVVAIEAKIGNAKKALPQAIMNTRFSTQSYSLIDITNPAQKTISEYKSLGIGIIAGDKYSTVLESAQRKLPVSCTTLKFNDWIGRQIARGKI